MACLVQLAMDFFSTQVTRKLHCVTLKPGLHIVVTIAKDASDDAPKRNLRLPTHRLQIFFVKYEYLRSLQPCEDQGTCEKLKKRVFNHVLTILTTYIETRIQVCSFGISPLRLQKKSEKLETKLN